MVNLKSLRCDYCPCWPLEYASSCFHCGKFRCNKCQEKNTANKVKCEVSGKPGCELNEVLHVVLLLQKIGDVSQLAGLHFEDWTPFRCDWCWQGITLEHPLGYVRGSRIKCLQCLADSDQVQYRSPDRSGYVAIIEELCGMFRGREPCREKNPIDLLSLSCAVCASEDGDGGFHVNKDGNISCFECYEEGPFNEVLDALEYLIGYVPDVGALKSLDYDQWTPFRCQKCAGVLSEDESALPVWQVDLRKILCRTCVVDGQSREYQKKHIDHMKQLVEMIVEFRALFKPKEMIASTDVENFDARILKKAHELMGHEKKYVPYWMR